VDLRADEFRRHASSILHQTNQGGIVGQVRFSVAVSLDGFMAGPDQSIDDPLGKGGMQLHGWAFELAAFQAAHGGEGGAVNASTRVVEEATENVGAYIMGRNMFGGGRGDWPDPPWNGWWGDDPPYHTPVFVLTHHPREPLELEGGTTFHFVTDGIEAALERAREAAGDRDIVLAGGASTLRQYLAAGLVDELQFNLVPVLLGAGERPLDDLGGAGLSLENTRVIDAPGVTHLTYRVVR
jgi:dihydrofolate reductase